MLDEQLDQFGIARFHRHSQWIRSSPRVAGRLGAGGQEHPAEFHSFRLLDLQCHGQCICFPGTSIGLGAGSQKHLDGVSLAGGTGHHECGAVGPVRGVEFGTALGQQRQPFISLLRVSGCNHQRCGGLAVAGIDARPGIEQDTAEFGITRDTSLMQRRLSLVVERFDTFRIFLDVGLQGGRIVGIDDLKDLFGGGEYCEQRHEDCCWHDGIDVQQSPVVSCRKMS